jgi:FixJ family two-component response regulator
MIDRGWPRNNVLMTTHPRGRAAIDRRQKHALISVIDDDESVRESLPGLLETLGFRARPFASAEAFLASNAVLETQCLISDVSMPSMSGRDLQTELGRRKLNIPIIFITGRREPTLRATLLAAGATECLFKPFSEAELDSALAGALLAV